MSEANTTGAPTNSPTAGKTNQGTEAASAKTVSKDQSQVNLESMSGAELSEYFAAQKAAKAGQVPETKASPRAEAKRDQPDPVKEAAKAATEAVRKFKVKVEGQEMEVEESELIRGYSHQRAANKILQEGTTARKQAEEFISMMRDPAKFYDTAKKLGHDPRKLAEEYLAKQLETELMDPRDRELAETKMKLKQMEELDKQQKEAMEAKRNEVLKQKYAQDYSNQFVEALQQTGLPPTKPMVAEMAKYVSRAAKIGFKLTAVEAAQLVQDDIQIAHRRLIGDADGDVLMKLLGEDIANKVRKYDTQRLKNPEQGLKTPTEQGDVRAPRPRGDKRMTPKEWREYNRRGR